MSALTLLCLVVAAATGLFVVVVFVFLFRRQSGLLLSHQSKSVHGPVGINPSSLPLSDSVGRSEPAGTTAQRVAWRYAPVYNMATNLDHAQVIVAWVSGAVMLLSLGAAVTKGSGPAFAAALFAMMWGVAVWFSLGFAAAILRIAADVAVDLAPGLSDQEKISLQR